MVAGPLIGGPTSTASFWLSSGVAVLLVGALLFMVTPSEQRATALAGLSNMLSPFKIVFANPQSYSCGLVGGLLFAPTTILDMIWGVRVLQEDRLFPYKTAVVLASMVPLGWVFGCPLFGLLSDALRRRKAALSIGASLMLVFAVQLTFLPGLLPTWLTLFAFGLASGSAMIPYTIIKEVNPDNVKGSATGVMNFLTCSVTAVIAPLFASHFEKGSGNILDRTAHLHNVHMFWIATLIMAAMLRETGSKARPLADANT
jgi:sugar phosphate permease